LSFINRDFFIPQFFLPTNMESCHDIGHFYEAGDAHHTKSVTSGWIEDKHYQQRFNDNLLRPLTDFDLSASLALFEKACTISEIYVTSSKSQDSAGHYAIASLPCEAIVFWIMPCIESS
jgi:hypothetical protein